MRRSSALVVLALTACLAEPRAPERPPLGPVPEVRPAAPVLHRLTAAQYRNGVRDLLGDVVLTAGLEPDHEDAGLAAVGASRATISSWGVEQYEAAAFELAAQALSPERRARVLSCTPAGVVDLGCARTFAQELGRRAWRRPLEEEELAELVATATTGAAALQDFYAGLELALAALLQSPHFLFRVELGQPDPEVRGERRYGAYEMASRLSYLFWNSTPDDELLDAAARGELLDEESVGRAVDRLLASPRAREGMRAFFTDNYDLARLDGLVKDPKVFTHYSPELGALAREQTLRDLEHLVFEQDGDFREIFTAESTFVDRRLAAIYDVRAPSRDGFAQVALPAAAGRRGLLGQVSVLALHAHPVSSSATRRGAFVRTTLLCDIIPPPPVDVNTALPEPSAEAVTLRERVRVHLENPVCAACHRMMDPIGLGLERFDGIGRRRELEHGAWIDDLSELDGQRFQGLWELGQVLRDHEKPPRCLTRNLYRYATGQVEGEGERAQLDYLTQVFAHHGYRVAALLRAVALSPGFRRAQEVEP